MSAAGIKKIRELDDESGKYNYIIVQKLFAFASIEIETDARVKRHIKDDEARERPKLIKKVVVELKHRKAAKEIGDLCEKGYGISYERTDALLELLEEGVEGAFEVLMDKKTDLAVLHMDPKSKEHVEAFLNALKKKRMGKKSIWLA